MQAGFVLQLSANVAREAREGDGRKGGQKCPFLTVFIPY